jgi:hypothetical protein
LSEKLSDRAGGRLLAPIAPKRRYNAKHIDDILFFAARSAGIRGANDKRSICGPMPYGWYLQR